MFIGHFGISFIARKYTRKPSLGTLFLAAQFLDLLWPLLLLFDVEHVRVEPGNTAFTPLDFAHYPVSHSLLSVFIWSALFGLIYYFLNRGTRDAVWLSVLVLSHWVLDLITHGPDLPLVPGAGPKVGLGLWNSVAGTLMFEGLIFAAGIIIYTGATRAKNRAGAYGFWGLLVFLLMVYLANLLGPPPPNAETIPYVGLSQWLLIFWGYWVDRNRASV